jgi:hypothetical protein
MPHDPAHFGVRTSNFSKSVSLVPGVRGCGKGSRCRAVGWIRPRLLRHLGADVRHQRLGVGGGAQATAGAHLPMMSLIRSCAREGPRGCAPKRLRTEATMLSKLGAPPVPTAGRRAAPGPGSAAEGWGRGCPARAWRPGHGRRTKRVPRGAGTDLTAGRALAPGAGADGLRSRLERPAAPRAIDDKSRHGTSPSR